jgi:hypothetical protein
MCLPQRQPANIVRPALTCRPCAKQCHKLPSFIALFAISRSLSPSLSRSFYMSAINNRTMMSLLSRWAVVVSRPAVVVAFFTACTRATNHPNTKAYYNNHIIGRCRIIAGCGENFWVLER